MALVNRGGEYGKPSLGIFAKINPFARAGPERRGVVIGSTVATCGGMSAGRCGAGIDLTDDLVNVGADGGQADARDHKKGGGVSGFALAHESDAAHGGCFSGDE